MNILHYVSLDGRAGVELQFAEFIAAAAQGSDRHRFIACNNKPNRDLPRSAALTQGYAGQDKAMGPFKLPKWPAALRPWYRRKALQRERPDLVVLWNRLRDGLATMAAAGDVPCLYWERGSAWSPTESPARIEFVRRLGGAICNSNAAGRMLQLRWGYRGDLRVVLNALRPSLLPQVLRPRAAPSGRPIRLGVVARLAAVKGVALAIHGLAAVRREGLDASLHIAGEGPERERLEALTKRLGLQQVVVFHGYLRDPRGFYETTDCLIHPALREPFGQVVLEAAAYGCPAVVAAVDGLPETLVDGVSGVAVEPQLPVADYAALGGSSDGLPPQVYDPVGDRLLAPRLLAPDALAHAVLATFHGQETYASLSQQAVDLVRTRFDFHRHVAEACAAMQEFAATGSLASESS